MVDSILFNEVPIFSLLDDEERSVLAKQVSQREFKKAQAIFKAGDPSGLAYVVQRGLVHVSSARYPGANHHDEPEPAGYEGSCAKRTRLPRQLEGGGRD